MHSLIQLLLAATVLTAAACDLRWRRIPNWLTAPAIVGGLAANLALGGLHGALWGGVGMLLGGGVYLVFYWLRAMGAGDVKLMAAAGSQIGPDRWLELFFWSALAGGVVALITLLQRGRGFRAMRNLGRIVGQLIRFQPPHRADPTLDVRHAEAATSPHGVAIAIGALILLVRS